MKKWLSSMLAVCLILSMTFAGAVLAEATLPSGEVQPEQAEEVAPAPEEVQPEQAEEATPAPEEVQPEQAEEVTPAPEEVQPMQAPADAQIWVQEGENRVYGALKDLIGHEGVLNVCTKQIIELKGYTVEQMKAFSLAPDREIFPEKSQVVIVSDLNPQGEAVEGSVFIWVGKASDLDALQPTPAPGLAAVIVAEDQDILETEIQVSASNYAPGQPCSPSFALSSSPALSEGQRFGVILDGGKAQPLAGNVYEPTSSGQLRFVVIDEAGKVLAKSSKYQIILPEATAEPEATVEPEATAEPEATVKPEATAEPEATVEPEATAEVEAAIEPEIALEARAMDAVTEIELSVEAIDYYPGELSDLAPSFILSGLPVQGGYRYGYSLNEGEVQALEGDRYVAELQGKNTLRFVILDAQGHVVARSAKYELQLDFESTENSRKQAWMERDGQKRYGTLQGLLAQAEAGDVIYIQSTEVMEISGGISALAGVSLQPDNQIFAGNYRVKISESGPSGQSGGLHVWVEFCEESEERPGEVEIQAEGLNYLAGQWTAEAVDFALSQIPAETKGYEFAVMVDGGMPVVLSAPGYRASEPGKHEIRFALLDGQGNIAAQTAVYSVWLDQTAPVVQVQMGAQYSLTVSAMDELSGELQISLDGGQSFQPMQVREKGGYQFAYQGQKGQAIEIGSLIVRDAAGNSTVYEQRIELQESDGMIFRPGGNFGGNFGGSGESGRTVSHSASSDSSTTAYNAVDLQVDEEAMSVLIVGDEQLNLSVQARNVQGERFQAQFVARLQTWNGQDGEAPDTLVLDAVTDGLAEAELDFLWQFDGSVYKKLAASGVDYLVLKVDDALTAISTAGFTAGSRYSLLKTQGVASRQFVYTVETAKDQQEIEIWVSVEGQDYQLSAAEGAEMYYYDVYAGGREMMDRAFGANAR